MSGKTALPIANPPRLVLFDLDDTLCDHSTSLRVRLHMAFGPAFDGISGVDLHEVVEASAARSIAGTEHFAAVLGEFGVTDPERISGAIQRYIGDRYRGLKLYDESLEVIQAIRRRKQLGLITNGPSKIQRDKLMWLDIAHLFPLALVSEEEGIAKPDPEIFHRALRLAGSQPDEAIYIGNAPEIDVAGAQAAGLHSVWINRGNQLWPGGKRPDHEIADLRALLPLLGLDGASA
ncbi:MAG TPA: HAD family hydrolase [Nitrolancea sp.]|nr:HAD family hydrolase [Nitrolancea sp.]